MAVKGAKSSISQRRVLDAAARIFRDSGYAGTTMRAVADEAGLQAGSLYYHYKGKDELISAVLDSGVSQVATLVKDALAALPATATGRQRIETAIEAHIAAIIAVGDYTLATRRVFGQVPQAIRTRHMRLRDAYGAFWDQLFEDVRAAGEMRPDADLKLCRLFVLGALNWTAEWYKPGAASIHDIAGTFGTLVLDGLLQPAPQPASRGRARAPRGSDHALLSTAAR